MYCMWKQSKGQVSRLLAKFYETQKKNTVYFRFFVHTICDSIKKNQNNSI